jgi:hypothetical protein
MCTGTANLTEVFTAVVSRKTKDEYLARLWISISEVFHETPQNRRISDHLSRAILILDFRQRAHWVLNPHRDDCDKNLSREDCDNYRTTPRISPLRSAQTAQYELNLSGGDMKRPCVWCNDFLTLDNECEVILVVLGMHE